MGGFANGETKIMDIPNRNQQVPAQPEEFKDFNHYYTVQFCISNCIQKCDYNFVPQYVAAVEMLEVCLSSDMTAELQKKIEELDRELYEELGAKLARPSYQFKLAKEKFRILYGYMKNRSPKKSVLAIGRPEYCPECKARIRWEVVRPKKIKVENHEPAVPTPQ